MDNLFERKNVLEKLLQEKAMKLEQTKQQVNELTAELLQLKGKFDLVDEMINEEKQKNRPSAVEDKK